MNHYQKQIDDILQGNGAHWGLTDWYPEVEAALAAALAAHVPFDTGWYASKKEIASARIRHTVNKIVCEASVLDDFDTEGYGVIELPNSPTSPVTLDQIRDAIDEAWQQARDNQKDNQLFTGYAIGQIDSTGERTNWLFTYIQPRGDGQHMDEPPGDCYHRWGWQEDDEHLLEMPAHVRKRFHQWLADETVQNDEHSLTVDNWRIDIWSD